MAMGRSQGGQVRNRFLEVLVFFGGVFSIHVGFAALYGAVELCISILVNFLSFELEEPSQEKMSHFVLP